MQIRIESEFEIVSGFNMEYFGIEFVKIFIALILY